MSSSALQSEAGAELFGRNVPFKMRFMQYIIFGGKRRRGVCVFVVGICWNKICAMCVLFFALDKHLHLSPGLLI